MGEAMTSGTSSGTMIKLRLLLTSLRTLRLLAPLSYLRLSECFVEELTQLATQVHARQSLDCEIVLHVANNLHIGVGNVHVLRQFSGIVRARRSTGTRGRCTPIFR